MVWHICLEILYALARGGACLLHPPCRSVYPRRADVQTQCASVETCRANEDCGGGGMGLWGGGCWSFIETAEF